MLKSRSHHLEPGVTKDLECLDTAPKPGSKKGQATVSAPLAQEDDVLGIEGAETGVTKNGDYLSMTSSGGPTGPEYHQAAQRDYYEANDPFDSNSSVSVYLDQEGDYLGVESSSVPVDEDDYLGVESKPSPTDEVDYLCVESPASPSDEGDYSG